MSVQCSMATLQSVLAGELPAEEETAVFQHLETCNACGEALERMAGGREWCRHAAALLTTDELDSATPSREEWSDIDFTVEHLEPSKEPNVLGRLGGYDVLEVIGHGGMGVVLKAFDRELKRLVAIKVLAPHLAHSPLAKKRFAREAQAAAAVLHPNVIAIHQVQTSGRLPFLVMPLVAGESLAQRLAARGTLDLKEILRIGMQAAAGLAAAHEQGLVHRDVKPANILLEKGVERAVLTDFGLARAADDVTLTRWGVMAGTPQYMSPEQARGEPLDGRSDLFSLGCVMYEMATGVSPFRADSTLATMRRLVDEPPRPMASLNPELPGWFIAIVDRLLEKNPSGRFASAKDVSDLLEGCLAHVQQPANVPLPEEMQFYGSSPTDRREQAERANQPLTQQPRASAPRLVGVRKAFVGAASAVALALAGVVIVLELNKGTLTIESVADDVALRITQGDEVVEKLTVTQAGKQVRIAAGTYVVEIDGKTDGIAVKEGSVTIERGGTEIVKIVRSDAPETPAALPAPAHPPRASGADDTDRDPGKPTAPTAADPSRGDGQRRPEPLGFSETKEVVLSMNSMKFMLDLDTGETMDPPATMRPGQAKMDVSTTQVQPYHYPTGLVGHLLQGREARASDWNASVADVRRALAGDIYALKQMDVGPEKTPTYFFKTRDGAAGVLQLLALVDEPKGIRLRYKTILTDAVKKRAPLPEKLFATKEHIAQIDKLIQDAPVTTSYLAELFELTPGSKSEYRLRADVVQIPIVPVEKTKVASLPLGKVLYLPASKGFYLQWDSIAASTLHYYGPFYGVPLATLGSVDPPALGPESPADPAPSSSSKAADKSATTFPIELRLGDSKPGAGLTEFTVEGGSEKVYVRPDAIATIADIESAKVIDDPNGQPAIEFTFKEAAAKRLAAATQNHRDKPLALLVNGKVVSAPTVRDRISGKALLSGTFSLAEARRMVEMISAMPKRIDRFQTTDNVTSMAYSADGTLIAIANGNPTFILQTDGTSRLKDNWKPSAEILNADTGAVVARLKLSTTEEDAVLAATPRVNHFEVTAIAFSPTADMVAVGTSIGQVKLFDARTGELMQALDDEKPKGADLKTPDNWQGLKRAMGRVEALAFSPDGSLLAVCGHSFADFADRFDAIERGGLSRFVTGPGRLKVWDVKSNSLKHDLVGHSHAFDVDFSADGSLLVSAGYWHNGSDHGNGVLVWNPQTGEKLHSLLIDANGGTHYVAFSPEKKLIVTGSIRFDKENDTKSTAIGVTYPLSGVTEWVRTMPGWSKPAFMPGGKSVAVLSLGQSLRLIDAETGQSKHEIQSPDAPVARWNDLAISAKASRLAIGGKNPDKTGVVEVWSLDEPAHESK